MQSHILEKSTEAHNYETVFKIEHKKNIEYEIVESKVSFLNEFDTSDIMNDIQKRAFNQIIKVYSPEIAKNITLETEFNSIGLDSILFIQTVVNLETEFDFEFDDEKLLIIEFPTVSSMLEYVKSKVAPLKSG